MQADIHPTYADIKVTCSCGNAFKTRSTAGRDIHLDICSKCHPFYTGQQKLIDTEKRVDSFMKKFSGFGAAARKAHPNAEKKS